MPLRRFLVPALAFGCIALYASARYSFSTGPSALSWADLWTLVVSVLLGLFALFGPLVVCRGGRAVGGNYQWASLFTILGMLVGVVTQTAVGEKFWYLAPIAAFAVGAPLLALSFWLWLLPVYSVYELQRIKADPMLLQAGIERVLERLHTWQPRGRFSAKRHANVSIAAASVLSEMCKWNEANLALEDVQLDLLDSMRRALVQGSRAVAFLYLGKRRAAWDAIHDASRHAEALPALRPSLAISAELIASLDGPPEPVLKKLDEIGRPPLPVYRRGWLIARANALVASGDVETARTCLEELGKIAPDGLERAIALEGPASRLAADMKKAILATSESRVCSPDEGASQEAQ
jgi:hypothetical protein